MIRQLNPDLKNARILIIDDKQANIDVLTSLLEMQSFTYITTTLDSREAVSLFQSVEPDLVLLDLQMPYLDGFEVMKQFRTMIPADNYLPILVLTADITGEARQKALEGGANDFLVKPFDLIEVGLRINNLLMTRYLYLLHADRNRLLEEKVAERTSMLEKSNIKLIKAKEKAEAGDLLKTAFIQNISHEIRTPLNGILGFGSLIADPEMTAEDRADFLPMLQLSCNRLMKTITDYVDVSMIFSNNLVVRQKPVDLRELYTEIVKEFTPTCQEKSLQFVLPDTVPTVIIDTDPDLLRKVIIHLLDNAIKFTSKGSVSFGYEVNAGTVTIYVSDTGVGIDDSAKELIFESFMQENITTTRQHEGSGLGLSIVKGILDALGSKISITSEKHKGSSFSFVLPLENVYKSENQADVKVKSIEPKPLLLLSAEDDDANQLYIEILLRDYDVQILHASNGLEAVNFCKSRSDIDLVLMDIKMPVMNGIDATKEIKKMRKTLPVIALTSYTQPNDKIIAKNAGCDAYLTKPVDENILISKLTQFGLSSSNPATEGTGSGGI